MPPLMLPPPAAFASDAAADAAMPYMPDALFSPERPRAADAAAATLLYFRSVAAADAA